MVGGTMLMMARTAAWWTLPHGMLYPVSVCAFPGGLWAAEPLTCLER